MQYIADMYAPIVLSDEFINMTTDEKAAVCAEYIINIDKYEHTIINRADITHLQYYMTFLRADYLECKINETELDNVTFNKLCKICRDWWDQQTVASNKTYDSILPQILAKKFE